MIRAVVAAVALAACAPSGGIEVEGLAAPAPVNVGSPSEATMAVYATFVNGGDADTLVEVRSQAAARVSIHATMDHGGVAMMMPAEQVPVAAGASVRLAPGDMHVMLESLARQYVAGDTIDVTFVFRRAGAVAARVPVVSYDQLERALAP